MNAGPEVIVKKPKECCDTDIEDFVALVLAGGEVTGSGLPSRVRKAAYLIFATHAGCLRAVAALKHPEASYRKSVAAKAGVPLPTAAFPFELGWIFVMPSARGTGLSGVLVEAAIAAAGGAGLFATSRSDNVRMHSSLQRRGFSAAGPAYPSARGEHRLQLFTRPAPLSEH